MPPFEGNADAALADHQLSSVQKGLRHDMLAAMRASGLIVSVSLAILFMAVQGESAFAQGTMVRPVPESANRDSSGNLKKEDDSASKANLRIHGVVVSTDGAAPQALVEIDAACPEFQRMMVIADSKGKFSFSFDAARLSDNELMKGCVIYAAVEGYRSEKVSLDHLNTRSGGKLERLVLQPIATDLTGLVSVTDRQAAKEQRKGYDKALDEAARQDWKGAIATLRKVVLAYPEYSSAWLNLGILQQIENDRAGAEKSFLESARVDSTFAPPLVRAAAVEAMQGDTQAALDHSQSAIDINQKAFPEAYALNAIAKMTFQNTAAAEKSARDGLRLDTIRQFPELEYALGVVLYSKDDRQGAAEHLRKYVEQSPNGPNAGAARN